MTEIPGDTQILTLQPVTTDGSTPYLGAIGETPTGHAFLVYEVSDCARLELVATLDFNFDYRTVPTPGFGAARHVPRTPGIKLLSGYDPNSTVLTFIHYDGYDIWKFTASPAGSSWRLEYERRVVHTDRTDLAVPALQ